MVPEAHQAQLDSPSKCSPTYELCNVSLQGDDAPRCEARQDIMVENATRTFSLHGHCGIVCCGRMCDTVRALPHKLLDSTSPDPSVRTLERFKRGSKRWCSNALLRLYYPKD
eukprot:6078347-Amphidinium_carterae.1